MQNHQLLEWYLEAGVDEAISDTPTNYFALAAVPASKEKSIEPPALVKVAAPVVTPLHYTPTAAIAVAREMADQAVSLEDLERRLRGFDGCALKKTASKMVFCDGNPRARVMIIGDAPSAQDDVEGLAFCGPSGQLLDKMLAAIGLDRSSVYLSNAVFWRPPGNRQPSTEEIQTCLPFVEKHIALVRPDLLILLGGTSTTALLRKDTAIARLRGTCYDYTNAYMEESVTAMVTFHPSYLLRTGAQKRFAWHDLLMVKDYLDTHPSRMNLSQNAA